MPTKEYRRKWNSENKDKIKEYQKRYYEKNKEKRKATATKWRKTNSKKYNETRAKWRDKNRDKINQQYRDSYHSNANIKIARTMRSRIRKVLKGIKKYQSTVEYIGVKDVKELMSYLETKFLAGMNWENYGQDGWHVDHIIPLSSFDLSDDKEAYKAFHYTNLQPLWAKDNLAKGNKKI